MQKTKIEWADYSLNPVKGLCPMGCSYCYARRMYKRFGWNPEIRFDYNDLAISVGKLLETNPSRIFWGSTFELFHDSVWTYLPIIFQAVKVLDQHTHIFLTKRPENLIRWSPYPDNCWIGVSITGHERGGYLEPFIGVEAKIKFLSCEPLLKKIIENAYDLEHTIKIVNLSWVIIGQQTPVSKKTMPKIEWIQEIVEACDKARVPVFLKNNLKNLLPARSPFVTNPLREADFYFRQELP